MTPSTRALTLKLAFPIGGVAHLRAREERLEGRVTGLVIEPGAIVRYRIVWGDGCESLHYDFELTEEPPL